MYEIMSHHLKSIKLLVRDHSVTTLYKHYKTERTRNLGQSPTWVRPAP